MCSNVQFLFVSIFYIDFINLYEIAYNDIRGFMTNDYFKRNLNPEPPNSFVNKTFSTIKLFLMK
jgi:hypothetical protein